MTIGKKLCLCFAGMLVIEFALSISGWTSVNTLGRMQDDLIQSDLKQNS
jgi:hypothetical protein